MNLNDLFASIETTLLSRFKESGFVQHSGDKGENREEILRKFLVKHLPKRFGVTKGEVITKDAKRSHAIDIIIYDAINCPVLYSEKTSIVSIEGVYGIIEVKSSLSKVEFCDAADKICNFKKLAPRDLGVIATRQYVTVHRASRPFGIVLGYQLAGNSLDSLKKNWQEQCDQVHDVNYFCNMIAVLGQGILSYENVNLSKGEKHLLLDTDEFVNLVLTAQKKTNNNEQIDETILRIITESESDRTFGRLFTYLLIMLTKMKLNVPDIGQYIDPDLPIAIVQE